MFRVCRGLSHVFEIRLEGRVARRWFSEVEQAFGSAPVLLVLCCWDPEMSPGGRASAPPYIAQSNQGGQVCIVTMSSREPLGVFLIGVTLTSDTWI